ncbi:TetR/AcrR family transcriptional regulator [Paractinoplanes hotanensis]|uniref:TetR/AcrR family transcriptional regulator n=1 Tax=Paractinoplanes hotanensis TaxID=2906497 RepID=A0ABT0XW37_9ACTN|nr:TetR/AcrR family transcriptional regulator [Actinoplanes hotanensis]MCM4078007.1 TetR/AcrR family transcriptional regulator [Actinoplanes hotanensis]
MPGQTNAERGRVVRARLLAAARELIGELGWSAVSTRVLAERAGVRPGLVHYHFESLQALLCHAALEEMRQMLDGATALLAQAESPADGIEAMLFDLDQYDGSDPASLLFIETYLAATRDRELRRRMGALLDGYRGALTEALTRSGHADAEGAASAVMSVLDGFVLHKGFDPGLSAARIAPLLRRITTTEEKGEHR